MSKYNVIQYRLLLRRERTGLFQYIGKLSESEKRDIKIAVKNLVLYFKNTS